MRGQILNAWRARGEYVVRVADHYIVDFGRGSLFCPDCGQRTGNGS